MIHTPNDSILPCVCAFHKINIHVGFIVTTNLHILWPAANYTMPSLLQPRSAHDGKAGCTCTQLHILPGFTIIHSIVNEYCCRDAPCKNNENKKSSANKDTT